MSNQLTAVILDDETILIDGRKLAENDEIANTLRAALQRDPDFLPVIAPTEHAHYKGTGKVM